MQLRKPETLGVVHDHYGSVGNVYADFYNRSRNEQVYSPFLKVEHNLRFFVVLHFAVQKSDFNARQFLREFVEYVGNAHKRAFVVALDFRANAEYLSARFYGVF